MTLAKWNPWREMEDLVDRYSKALGWPRGTSNEIVATGDWVPRVDIAETEKEFAIKVEIPDVKKEDIRVTIEDRVLTIRGERKQETDEKGKKFHRVERFYGSFVRSFSLPDTADDSKVTSTFADGVLTLKIPKAEPAKSKAIEVKVS